jgi:hypothetical protein
MNRPVGWLVLSTAAGLLAGGVFGYLVARTTGCVVDGAELPANATCYRVFGTYVSGATYYTTAAALIGAWVGLVLGLFMVMPALMWRAQDPGTRMHPLELPVIWFGLQFLELAILVPALLFWMPGPGEWPEALRWGAWVVALLGVTLLNYRIRRRFIPH